ncbi:MAG: hypothetical protein JW982_15935 [Spirochaetes bacterium]|nr:hypothetical protein [Spirochaetota bacterium]
MNTSANVDLKFFSEICRAADEFNLSVSAVFRDIASLTIHRIKSEKVTGMITEYQDKNPGNWMTVHYSLHPDDIELFTIARQKYKISISKIAFIGFILFWHLLIEKYTNRDKNKSVSTLNLKSFLDNYEEYKSNLIEKIEYFKKRINVYTDH